MSLSMYSSPNWNTNPQTGGTQAQLNYMQGQAAQNMQNAQANLATGGPAAQSMFQYAQAKQNMMNGFNVNNAQSINWGNGPMAGGMSGSSGGGMSSGGFGGVSDSAPSMQASSGWGTGNNGAPTSGVGYNGQGTAMNSQNLAYSGPYALQGIGGANSAVANIFGNGDYSGATGPFISGSGSPRFANGQNASEIQQGVAPEFSLGGLPGGVMGSNGWQAPSGMPLGGNGGPTSNAIPNLNSGSNVKYFNDIPGANLGNGMVNMGGSTGASGSSGGYGAPTQYRQMDSSGLLQGQMDGLMGYSQQGQGGYTSPFGISNQNNIFNSGFGMDGGE